MISFCATSAGNRPPTLFRGELRVTESKMDMGPAPPPALDSGLSVRISFLLSVLAFFHFFDSGSIKKLNLARTESKNEDQKVAANEVAA